MLSFTRHFHRWKVVKILFLTEKFLPDKFTNHPWYSQRAGAYV